MLYAGLAVAVVGAFLGLCLRQGHVRACTDLVILLVLTALGSVAFVFEFLRWVLFPLNWVQRRWLRRARADVRRLVIFDGICVLCNKFGRFSFYRLVNPDLVSFVPFQDSQHINIDELQAEFKFGEAEVKSRIAFVSGDRIFWGADAIIELCRWFDWPFPLARFAYLVPRPMRDVLYQMVADNRYRWFGTQALDKNFARQLCPYYYFKGKKDGPAHAAGASPTAMESSTSVSVSGDTASPRVLGMLGKAVALAGESTNGAAPVEMDAEGTVTKKKLPDTSKELRQRSAAS